MENQDYYNDHKYCTTCNKYVSYLMSIDQSFCVECGGVVRLFSEDDWVSFNSSMDAKRPKGGRPRKNAQQADKGRETA
ncbi:MAG: hypothetical protein ACI835_003776 [Planctomycetota bacterium]|jgi:hypothetical protein